MKRTLSATNNHKPRAFAIIPPAEMEQKRPLRILHLEDNPNDAELIRSLLESEGFVIAVSQVSTEAGFAALIDQGNFDLILSDYSLPSFDGKSALKMARTTSPDIPFIFVSGTLGEEAAIDSLKEGATDYVIKNRLKRLKPAIERALREKQEETQRKLAEKHLHQSAEMFRQITENVADLIAVLDLEGKWFYNSPSYRTIFEESELSPGVDSFAKIHPEDRDQMRRLFEETARTGSGQRAEFRYLLPDGGIRFIESQASAIRDQMGEIANVITLSRDITERKQSEEGLRRAQTQLERTNKDLLKKQEEIQSFYHTLSHELKTPLTSAREFISIVMDGLAGPVTETQFDYLRIAKESCNQLRVCLNDLLDTTRLETGKLRIELKPILVGNLVQKVMSMMGPVATAKKIRLIKNVQSGLPEALLDENRIMQVLTNLLNNALKFTLEGGKISLKVCEAPGHPDRLQVSVSDTGRGIPKDQLDRIFDRLFQVKLGDAATEKGIGLGLYICRELVELHGGRIWVESEVESGSTFTFELPNNPSARASTVLVVDDDPLILEAVRCSLERQEFNVTTARGGTEALRLMEHQVPDVLLMDLEMPDMNGAEVLKEVRRNWGAVPVIVHTGYPDSELMKRALESSPFTVLAKPSAENQLAETVRMVMRQSDTFILRKNRAAYQNAHAQQEVA